MSDPAKSLKDIDEIARANPGLTKEKIMERFIKPFNRSGAYQPPPLAHASPSGRGRTIPVIPPSLRPREFRFLPASFFWLFFSRLGISPGERVSRAGAPIIAPTFL